MGGDVMDQQAVDQLHAQISQLRGEIERMREALVVLLANPTSELMKNIARAVLEKTK
jgi:TolA-binding protein